MVKRLLKNPAGPGGQPVRPGALNEIWISTAALVTVAVLTVLWRIVGGEEWLVAWLRAEEPWAVTSIHAATVLVPVAIAAYLILRLMRARSTLLAELLIRAELLDNVTDPILVYDSDGTIVYVNAAAWKSRGDSEEELMRLNRRDLATVAQAALFEGRAAEVMEKGEATFESVHLRKDGREIPVEIHSRRVRLAGSDLLLDVCRDVTSRKELEEKLVHLATHDGLTGMPNRGFMTDRLYQAITRARRHRKRMALMVVDIDGFKAVNAALGHPGGDWVLQVVGMRLQNLVRKSDSVGRVGGDEFIIVLSEVADAEGAARVARRVVEGLGAPIPVAGGEVRVTVSMGVAIYPEDGEDSDILTRHADAALYRAKAEGRNTYRMHSMAADGKAASQTDLFPTALQ